MHVRMVHRLTGRSADVYANRKAVGGRISLKRCPYLGNKAPEIDLLPGTQVEDIGYVALRDDEGVPRIQREVIREEGGRGRRFAPGGSLKANTEGTTRVR